MNALLDTYHIPFAPFQHLLQTRNALLAGSAPLAVYLQEHDIDPGFTPHNLNLWVEDHPTSGNREAFLDFFQQLGYETVTYLSTEYTLLFQGTRRIQLLFVPDTNLLEYLALHFDLSCCMTWWDATENHCETVWPEETLHKRMFAWKQTERERQRVTLYESRGFRLVDWPCLSLLEADPRTHLHTLAPYTAFDVIAYEEVNAAEFLRASSFHVLLRVGQQFYAFHRDTLHTYFQNHHIVHPLLGSLFDTPCKQTVTAETVHGLRYADDSIVELIPDQTVSYRNTSKAVHSARFYTVEGWSRGMPSKLFSVPQEPSLPSSSSALSSSALSSTSSLNSASPSLSLPLSLTSFLLSSHPMSPDRMPYWMD